METVSEAPIAKAKAVLPLAHASDPWPAKKLSIAFMVEAPCFRQGKLDFSPTKKQAMMKWASAQGLFDRQR